MEKGRQEGRTWLDSTDNFSMLTGEESGSACGFSADGGRACYTRSVNLLQNPWNTVLSPRMIALN
uniref:Uncharacterized protein n=1 Tax=Brassica oleracea TaxID=3712 RepID=A0A3P6BU39_BRAOL|nr:unnamed protein product [Brassica oleracea]